MQLPQQHHPQRRQSQHQVLRYQLQFPNRQRHYRQKTERKLKQTPSHSKLNRLFHTFDKSDVMLCRGIERLKQLQKTDDSGNLLWLCNQPFKVLMKSVTFKTNRKNRSKESL